MGGFGGSISDSSSSQELGTLSPFFPALNQILSGQGVSAGKGGFQLKNDSTAGGLNGVLTEENIQSIGQLFEPRGTNSALETIFGGGPSQQALDLTQFGIQNITENVIPGLTDLASNDPSTFFDPAAESFLNAFKTGVIPQIQEQFGQDQFNTDIAGQANFTGQQALLDIALGSTQQAAQFATQASPILAALHQSLANAPVAISQDVLGLEEGARQSERINSEGGTVLDTLLTLAGIPNTFGNVGESESFSFGTQVG